jgi:hypothetical protein
VLCLLLPAALAAAIAAESPRVGRWDRFEVEVTNARAYVDPYADVQADAIFTAPGGFEIAVPGFYDGGQTWRVRCLPHLTGRWQYRVMFSDGSAGKTGEFTVQNSNLPGPLTANRANPIWFTGDVRPVLVRGLHVGDRFFAANWPEENRVRFLDWAAQQGYNFLSIASHYLNRDDPGRGRGWETPRLWPLDAGEFRKMERILDDLARRSMYVYPFAGMFGQKSNYPTQPNDQEKYIRYTMARIGGYWNVVLNVAGPEPNLRDAWMPGSDVERLGRLIRDANKFGHALSVHNVTGDDPYRDSDWTTYGTLQGPKTLDRAELSAGLLKNHHPAKPLLAQETLWSGNTFHVRKNKGADYSDDDLRKSAFVINFSAAALVYGDFAGDSSSGFSGTMELERRSQRKHDIVKAVWDLFTELPYYDLKPRQDLVSSGYCLALPGRHYFVYLENGGAVDVKIDAGPYVVSWINAREPAQRVTAGTTSTGAGLQAPGEGDWVLRLARTNTGLADQIHLSWQRDPTTTLTVTWHSVSQDNEAVVEHRPAAGGPWKRTTGASVKSPGDGWIHRATLEGLAPGTDYEYRVSNDRGFAPEMSTTHVARTAPVAGAGFSAAFVADTGLIGRIDGNATGTQRVMAEVLRHRPTFILGGGDYAYFNRDRRFARVGDAADEWFNQWQPVLARFPFMAQFGNHEDFLDERFTDWADRFAHPPGHAQGSDYSFTVGRVHFVALYVTTRNIPDVRLAWLDATLRAARERGVRWIVVYQHEPIYAHGRSHPAYPEVRQKIAPLLERHRVDVHLSTHDQNYERTYPLTGVPPDVQIRSRALDRYRQGEGVLYVKVSPGGKKSEIGNEFSRFTAPQQEFIAVRESGYHHYAFLTEAATGELRIEAFRLGDRQGGRERIDTFVIEPPAEYR